MNKKIIIIALLITLIILVGCKSTTPKQTTTPNQTTTYTTTTTISTTKPTSTSKVENKPIIVSEEYKNENAAYNMTVIMSIPQVEGIVDKTIQDKINNRLKSFAIGLKDEFEAWAKEDYESLSKGDKPWPHSFDFWYDTQTINKDVLSITVTNSEYAGGAHGITNTYGFTFSLNSGKEYMLSDLFAKNYDYVSAINKEIFDNNKEFKGYMDDYQYIVDDFKGIEPNAKYYIKDNKIVIFYNPYDIAPYAMGYLEFYLSDNIKFNIE